MSVTSRRQKKSKKALGHQPYVIFGQNPYIFFNVQLAVNIYSNLLNLQIFCHNIPIKSLPVFSHLCNCLLLTLLCLTLHNLWKYSTRNTNRKVNRYLNMENIHYFFRSLCDVASKLDLHNRVPWCFWGQLYNHNWIFVIESRASYNLGLHCHFINFFQNCFQHLHCSIVKQHKQYLLLSVWLYLHYLS